MKKPILAGFLLFELALTSCAQNTKEKVPTTSSTASTTKKVTIPVGRMSCASCQSNVRKNLKGMNGVSGVEVSLEHSNATVTFDTIILSTQQLINKINEIGYSAGKAKEGNP